MTDQFEFSVDAWPESGVLCRIIGVFGQLDLPPPRFIVEPSASVMKIEISTEVSPHYCQTLTRRIDAIVGVDSVRVSNNSLSSLSVDQ